MSQNIFYDNVDANLQEELNARGRAGFYDRSTKSLDFMLGKIANVEIIAYTTGSADPNKKVGGPHGVLGGRTVTQGRYLPDGPDGFLNDRKTYVETSVDFYKTAQDTPSREDEQRGTSPVPGRAFNKQTQYADSSRRIGPYISNVDISVGDHSMGLLNKATVQIVIPNPQRDLDGMEELFEKIELLFEEFKAEHAKTTKAAHGRARKALGELAKAVKARRNEITATKNARKEAKA